MKNIFWKPLLNGVVFFLIYVRTCTYRMLILRITQHSPNNTHFYPANELLLKIKIKCHAHTFSFWIPFWFFSP